MREGDIPDLKIKPQEKGSILIIVLLVGVVLLLLTTPFLLKLGTTQRMTVKTFKEVQAFSLAESGVESTIWELNHGDITSWAGDDNARTLTLSNFQHASGNVVGDINVTIQDPTTDNPVVTSMGRVKFIGNADVDRTVRVTLEKGTSSIWDFGIFGDEGLHLNSNMMVDSYDSRDGPYGGTNVKANGKTGTNATGDSAIYMDSNAVVNGPVSTGVGSDPNQVIELKSSATINGSTQALTSPKELPSVIAPSGLPDQGNFWIGDDNTLTISQSGQYSDFTLDSNAIVTITGDVQLYVTGAFNLLSNAQLILADGASLELYVAGSYFQDSNTTFSNLSQDPTKLMVLGLDSLYDATIKWYSNTEFYGAVYMPSAYIDVDSNTDFYGAMIGRYLEMDSNIQVHYDEALGGIDTFGSGPANYIVKSWHQLYN